MGLSISSGIGNVLEYLLKRKDFQREKMADYLDSIAEDARTLADIWKEIWDKVKNQIIELNNLNEIQLYKVNENEEMIFLEEDGMLARSNDDSMKHIIKEGDSKELIYLKKLSNLYCSGIDASGNLKYYCRLAAFYNEVKTGFDSNSIPSDYRTNLSQKILKILITRKLTKKSLGEIALILKDATYLDDSNKLNKIFKLSELVVILQREAAAIEVLAKKYRAFKD